MVLPFFTLYLTRELGYGEAAAGRMLGIYGLGSIVGAYAGGRLAGRWGAVRLQIVFLTLAAPICLAVPLFHSASGIAIAMFLLSFFAEGVRPAIATAIAQFSAPPLQVRAFGLHRMALNLGISFGPAIGGVLATVGFVWLFVVDAATTFLCAVALWAFFGFQRYAKTRSAAEPQIRDTEPTVSPWKDREYVVFLSLVLLASIVFFQFHATYPLFLRDHYGFSKPAIGALYAVNTSVIVALEMLLLDQVRQWPPLRRDRQRHVSELCGFRHPAVRRFRRLLRRLDADHYAGRDAVDALGVRLGGPTQPAVKSRDIHGVVYDDIFAGRSDRSCAGRSRLSARSPLVLVHQPGIGRRRHDRLFRAALRRRTRAAAKNGDEIRGRTGRVIAIRAGIQLVARVAPAKKCSSRKSSTASAVTV